MSTTMHEEMVSAEAMRFAMKCHAKQKRNYTGEQYYIHCSEVVGALVPILLSHGYDLYIIDKACAIAWLHDVIEDCGETKVTVRAKFGPVVAEGVYQLSEMDKVGNRDERKRKVRQRLSEATMIIQTIKALDCWSNGISISKHDPDFFVVFSKEIDLLLNAMTNTAPQAVEMVREIIGFPNAPKEYQVWREGYSATGDTQPAALVGTAMATSWQEARDMVYAQQSEADQRHWNKFKTTIWGCRLFRTEEEARKSFG